MRRSQSWQLRETLREHRDAPRRLQHCAITRYRKTADLVHGSENSAWWDGVVCCRSRICPVCWIARRAKAAREIEHVVQEREREMRTQTCMATLTVRHAAHHSAKLAREVRACWRLMLQRRRWRDWSKRHGLEWICAEEITRGDNGWHPHLHVLLLPREDIEDPITEADAWYETWAGIVEKRLGAEHVPEPIWGLDLRPCNAADYITKLGLELTDKNAIKGKAPLALLENGELDSYVELQLERTRARDLTFSRGLKSYRETMPETPMPAELMQVRGTDWGLLRSKDVLAPLDIAEHAHSPEEAEFLLQWWLGNPARVAAERLIADRSDRLAALQASL